MLRWLRRLLWLGLIGGVAAAAYTVWQRRQHEQPGPSVAPAEPAPLRLVADRAASEASPGSSRPSESASSAGSAPSAAPWSGTTADGAPPTWVAPVDGACPDGYPVKANASSRIYHVPGGRFYARTTPERCYASAADAEADGYRAAKS
jgi:hypothetical protein